MILCARPAAIIWNLITWYYGILSSSSDALIGRLIGAGISKAGLQSGIPVSTTHIISTSIMGVGNTKGVHAVKWGIVGNIVMAWVLTIPKCMALAMILYHILPA